jgi:hypothetical protein
MERSSVARDKKEINTQGDLRVTSSTPVGSGEDG